jgi:hypothetical protein
MLYLIILSLFFEGYVFSFYLFESRIRVVQILEIVSVSYLLFCIFTKRIEYKKSPIDLLIWSYIGINFIVLFKADWLGRSIKIFILLLSLVILYFILYNMLRTKKIFRNALNLLIYVGFFEILYGLYQVYAGAINFYFNARLPIGYMGMIHAGYIGSPWGRPYGTFMEPNWYGAVCMFYALLFSVLASNNSASKRKVYSFMFHVAFFGLFFSFTRGAWLGFAFGIISLFIFKNKPPVLNFTLYCKNFFLGISLIILVIILSSQVRGILKERFYPTYDTGASFSVNNARFQLIKQSVNKSFKNILIGSGPGSGAFKYLEFQIGTENAKKITKNTIRLQNGNEGFDPSIISTVMSDTGIIGLSIFILLVLKIFIFNIRYIPLLIGEYQLIGAGLFLGLSGLAISYIFTQGLWIPFTWVFLAFNIAVFRVGTKDDLLYAKKQ